MRFLRPGLVVAAFMAAGTLTVHPQAPQAVAPAGQATFASRVAQLSEREGLFDADDNLITNERSYLHVMPALRDSGATGGAYIGVGPDQNFSYIAESRPAIAFVIDIRRDNLLLHLLFKALFSLSTTRADYLSLLFGRPVPDALDGWRQADVTRLATYIENTRATAPATTRLRARVDAAIKSFGVPMSADDFATIDRFHRKFITGGLDMKFETARAAPAGYYPTYRQLLFETDREGMRRNFLVSEKDFQFVRSLEQRDLLIPVVGDLGGSTALKAIARLLTARKEPVSVFYASNVEYYLANDGKHQEFLNNLALLPHTRKSVLIRSVFGGFVLPQSVSGYSSTSLVQPIDELLDGFASGRFKSYNDLLLSR